MSQLTDALGKLLEIRVRQCAFHPQGQQILTISQQCFIVLRVSPQNNEHILSVTNVSNQICHLEIPLAEFKLNNCQSGINTAPKDNYWYDLIGNRGWRVQQQKLVLTLQPYDVLWLIPFIELEKSIDGLELEK